MTESKRDTRVTIDLLGYKQPWLDWCRARSTTPSDAFRQIVAKLTGQGETPTPHSVVVDEPEKPTVKKKVSLTPSEWEAIEKQAPADGFSPARWIVATIRARLTTTPQLGQTDIEALTQSNLLLLAMGRNLNQIAKALNAAPETRAAYKVHVIEEARALIAEHTTQVSKAMAANSKRWRIE